MLSMVVTEAPARDTAAPLRVSEKSPTSTSLTARLNSTTTAETDVVRGSGDTSMISAVGAGSAGTVTLNSAAYVPVVCSARPVPAVVAEYEEFP